VLADDLGYHDVNWRNNQTITPALDRLNAQGIEIPVRPHRPSPAAPAAAAAAVEPAEPAARLPLRLGPGADLWAVVWA